MAQEKIEKAINRIEAALRRIDNAADRIGSSPKSRDAMLAAKESLKGELAETLSDLDTLIESIEQ